MKKSILLATTLLAVTTFTVLPSQAQLKTYLSEDFTKEMDTAVWNLDECTLISPEVGPLYHVYTKGTPYGGWIYDPKGSLFSQGGTSVELNGDYSIVSKPVQLDSGKNVISFEYLHHAQSSTSSHNFSISVREEGNDTWTRVYKISSFSQRGLITTTLHDSLIGKKVELKFTFYTVSLGASYYFLMSNLKFAAYDDKPILTCELSAAPVAFAGKTYDVYMTFRNSGLVAVNSLKYIYTIDDIVEDDISISFTPSQAISPLIGTASRTANLDMTGVGKGNHVLKIYLAAVNGTDVEANDTIVWNFLTPDDALLDQAYVPLFEGFSSSYCSSCSGLNKTFNPVLEQLKKAGSLNVIKYQMHFPGKDPYYIEGNYTRMLFYDSIFNWKMAWKVPDPIYNGMEEILTWEYENSAYPEWTNQLKSKTNVDHKLKAMMSIDINKAEVNEAGEVSLEIDLMPAIDANGKFFVIVVEGTTTGNKGNNGETAFHDVAMAFVTDDTGEAIPFESGKKETRSYTVDMTNTHVEEMSDLKVVCFIQHESGYIFQSASAVIKSDGAANESLETLGNIRVYPNPAANFVNITNLENADVEIFELTGRRVYATAQANGDLQVSLTAFAEGTYVVRLTQDGQSVHRKLVVVK
ncbi:MAG: T9SS type A sorting domain-containing protein [Lentimicrobiaceae bacterium]|nr:T9SS type A sorting domain-containing protein [Lentimicrobiaceae bacterium]